MAKSPDTDTKTLILDAAERAFAELGFDAASMRHIIAAAGVNLAAVHYHFGSKGGLIQAVFARRVGPLNAERLELLGKLEATKPAKKKPPLEPIIRALIEPALKLARDPSKGGPDVMRLFGRMIAEPSADLQAMMISQFGEVARRFGIALARACPDLPEPVLIWRFHFMIGTMGHVMCDPSKIKAFTQGRCDPSDTEEVVRQMTSFLAGGFRAPVAKAKSKPANKKGSGKLKMIGLSLIAAITTACSTPSPYSASLSAPNAWSAAGSSNEPASAWWKSFGDTNLVRLVEAALVANHDLKAMTARVLAAMEQSRIAGAALVPSVTGQFTSAHQQQVFVGLPIPGVAGPLKSRSTSQNFQLVANWELDVWGRVGAGRKAALADYMAATDDLRGARLSLVGQIVRAWFHLAEAELQFGLAQARAKSFKATSDKIRARYEEGLRSPLDLRLAKGNAAAARAMTALVEAELNAARRQLQALLGKYPDGALRGPGALPILQTKVPVGLPSELMERRPDLLAANWRLVATGYRASEAKAARLPRISLTASGGSTSSELQDLIDLDFSIWSIAANAAQPIFQGGRLRANVRRSKALLQAAAEEYDSAILNAFREVETALASEEILQRREFAMRESSTQATGAEQLTQVRYEAGLDSSLTLLEAQRSALDAEAKLISVRRMRLDNRVALHLALGGGFEDPMPPDQIEDYTK